MKLLPSELESKFVIPALRRKISEELYQMGLNQTEISHYLCLTQAAISKYLKSSRGTSLNLSEEDLDCKVKSAAKRIVKEKDPQRASIELMRITKFIRDEGILCQIHRKKDDVPDDCDLCSRINC